MKSIALMTRLVLFVGRVLPSLDLEASMTFLEQTGSAEGSQLPSPWTLATLVAEGKKAKDPSCRSDQSKSKFLFGGSRKDRQLMHPR
eukprot:4321428-Amphidinium_carterae.1